MKKRFFIFLFCTVASFAHAQDKEIYLQSFVKEDTVQLRWAITSPDLFIKGLEEGYIITRTKPGSNEEINYIVLPFSKRKEDLLKSTDTVTLFTTRFIAEYMNNTTANEQTRQAPFFMFSLSASTNRAIANVLGVYWEDVNANKGNYRYSIRFATETLANDQVVVNASEPDKNAQCSQLTASSRVDLKEVYLKWEAKSLEKNYGGYWLMKSEDGKHFTQLNSMPLYYFTSQYEPDKSILDFIDTTVSEGRTYYYKVAPINHFAEIGEFSNVAEVYIQKRLNGICNIDTVRSDEKTRFVVGRYYSEIKTDEVSEYVLLRGDKIDATYRVIEKINAIENKFEFAYETDLLSGDRHYFKVAAVSPDGDSVLSYPYYHFSLDQEPPEKPTGFKGEIDENGIANLSWIAPADKDIKGYRIFRANSLNEEFVEVTTSLSPELGYADTLRLDNLTSEVYYRIRTVDLNYNNSKSTSPILVMKPDTIPPVPSVIKKYVVKPKGVYIEWANSQSTDIAAQYLLRKSKESVDTLEIFIDQSDHNLDSTCALGQKYGYQIVTEDRTGNTSFSNELTVTYETGFRLAPINLQGTEDRAAKMITLNWDLKTVESIYSVQIYRAKNEGKFKLHKTIREEVRAFEDLNLSPNNVYRYKVKVIYKSGKSSKMSETIEVVY